MAPLSVYRQLEALSGKKRPVVRLVLAMLVLTCALACALAGREILASRNDSLNDAEVSTSNVARAFALHAETTMKVADLVLEDAVERAEQDGMGQVAIARLRQHLEHAVAKAHELHGLFIYGADGGWRATSLQRAAGGNNADREYFRYHKTHPGRAVRIGAPIRSRSSGIWIIPVSRRIDGPDGSFAGVALATIRLDFFENVYSRLDVGATGTVMLALDDGTLYYRRPFADRLVGTDISQGPLMTYYRRHGPVGTAMLTARIDGVQRLYSYRHLNGYPLVFAAALSAEEIYAGWRSASLRVAGGLLFFIATLAWLGRKLLRQIALRERLEEQLHLVGGGLAQANAELSALALKDGLTQLANRRAFDDALAQELARAGRSGAPLSLLMLDADHFKAFNDRYGHPAGDACLQGIAGAIARQAARQTDLPARYGGEEFAVLLPATDRAGAIVIAERVRRAVADLGIAHASSPQGMVTVSVGVATLHPAAGGAGAAALLAAADGALYASKAAGRNRVTAHADEADEAASAEEAAAS